MRKMMNDDRGEGGQKAWRSFEEGDVSAEREAQL